MIEQLIKKARCYRRFDESFYISCEMLENIVNNLRFISSARNAQPLKYVISANSSVNEKIFKTLKWAGYLQNWNGPEKGEKPSAYIVVLRDKNISVENFSLIDAGIALQTIVLSLAELGLGSCTIAAINKQKLSELLTLNENLEILYVMAIGKPVENVILTDMKDVNDIKYYRDSKGNHYVPKRQADELLYKSFR